MASSLANLLCHMVFSTKDRCRVISPTVRDRLYPYMVGILNGENCRVLRIGGEPEHVHILAAVPPALAVAEALRRVKGNSSRWVNENRLVGGRFGWQRGYGAFSVSESSAQSVTGYIDRQAERHRKMTFQEEFILLLKKHKVEYDERYIWD